MINKQRVQRIKNAIYTVIVILFFLPLIMMIALCIVMINSLNTVSDSLGAIESYIVGGQAISEQASEPDQPSNVQGQAATPGASEADTHPKELNLDKQDEAEPEPAVSVGTKNEYYPTTFPNLRFDTLIDPQSLSKDTLYLTFDNTPSYNLHDILDVLEAHNIKATFFVWWGDASGPSTSGSDYRAIIDAGHSIGVHAAMPTTPLSALYASTESFLSDFDRIFTSIERETGLRTRLYRMPGGSVHPNNRARQEAVIEIKSEMEARGFLLYDWHISAQDAVIPPLSTQQIVANLYTTVEKGERVVALLHDGTSSDSTVQALDEFIALCHEDGYRFDALDYDIVPVSFLDQR